MVTSRRAAGLVLFKAEIDRVIELGPDDTEARTMQVFYYLSPKPMRDIDRAIEVCREIEVRDPISGKQLRAACYHKKKETERDHALAGRHRGVSRGIRLPPRARGHLCGRDTL